MVDSGASEYGLRPDAKQVFHGLGGAKRTAEAWWTVPIGIEGEHTTQEYFGIDGDMIGVTSRLCRNGQCQRS